MELIPSWELARHRSPPLVPVLSQMSHMYKYQNDCHSPVNWRRQCARAQKCDTTVLSTFTVFHHVLQLYCKIGEIMSPTMIRKAIAKTCFVSCRIANGWRFMEPISSELGGSCSGERESVTFRAVKSNGMRHGFILPLIVNWWFWRVIWWPPWIQIGKSSWEARTSSLENGNRLRIILVSNNLNYTLKHNKTFVMKINAHLSTYTGVFPIRSTNNIHMLAEIKSEAFLSV
jgi:hypothetical protein